MRTRSQTSRAQPDGQDQPSSQAPVSTLSKEVLNRTRLPLDEPEFDFIEPIEEDFKAESGGRKRPAPGETMYTTLSKEYPVKRRFGGFPNLTASGTASTPEPLPMFPPSAAIHERLSGSAPPLTPLSNSGRGEDHRNTSIQAGQAQSSRQLVAVMAGHERMDKRYVSVKHRTKVGTEPYSAIQKRGRSFYLSATGRQLRTSMEGGTENAGTIVKCKFLNGIAKAILGKPSYADFFHYAGNGTWKPDLRGVHEIRKADIELRPDILVLKKGRDVLSTPLDMHDIGALGEDKLHPHQDSKEKLLFQLQDYQRKQLLNQPLASNLVGFTMSGRRFRLWMTDPVNHIGSRPCDLGSEDDETINRFVDFVALLLGPLDYLCPGWHPCDTRTFEIEPLEVQDNPSEPSVRFVPSTVTDWIAGNDQFQHGISRIRGDIHGRRTVGLFRRGQVDNRPSPVSLNVKLSFLSRKYERHEYKVYSHLQARHKHRDAVRTDRDPRYCHDHRQIEQIPDWEQVYDRLPKCLGAIKIPYILPCRQDPDPAIRAQGDPNNQVVMSGLVFEGEPHRSIEDVGITLRAHIVVAYDVIRSIWLISAYDCHYRDLNLGNILIDSDGRGRLIDFGNVVLAMTRRYTADDGPQLAKKIMNCNDDGRSGNAYFLSTASMAGQKMTEELAEEKQLLRELLNKPEKDQHDREDIESREAKVAATEEAIHQHHTHRYTDDLESLIYVLLWQLTQGEGGSHHYQTHRINEYDTKLLNWNKHLEPLVNRAPFRIRGLIVGLARIVHAHQAAFKKKYEAGTMPVQMTIEEFECFRAFAAFMKKSLDEIPSE